ncbi:MAG TPA: PKD domain-containing protein, partial [Verrucomicrobiae bacterium]|nr:PKD domain-containing protein [Verrucomicrobiae bacterium]
VTCTAIDLAGNSASCSFRVTVTSGPLNTAPVADASATDRTVISGNNSNAVVHLDGTRSTDADGDPLTYAWLVDGGLVPVATGAIASIVLEVGTHTITLVVDDGLAMDTDVIEVNVLTAGEAVDEIIAVLNAADLGGKNKRPLNASLKAAVASFDRGNNQSGANQLEAFLNKLEAQIGRTNPVAAEALRRAVQEVLDALETP